MKEIYEAIFATNYSINNDHKAIGGFAFDASIKEFLLRTVSLLSPYANATID